jgi:hypothetical protein
LKNSRGRSDDSQESCSPEILDIWRACETLEPVFDPRRDSVDCDPHSRGPSNSPCRPKSRGNQGGGQSSSQAAGVTSSRNLKVPARENVGITMQSFTLALSPPVKQRSITFRRELIPGASLESNSGRISHPEVSGLRCKEADGMDRLNPLGTITVPPGLGPNILLSISLTGGGNRSLVGKRTCVFREF